MAAVLKQMSQRAGTAAVLKKNETGNGWKIVYFAYYKTNRLHCFEYSRPQSLF